MLISSWVIAAVTTRLFVGNTSQVADAVMLWLVYVGYYVIGNGWGGTFGKRLAKLRVVDAAGAVPGIRRAAVRAVLPYGLRLLLIVPLTLLSGPQSRSEPDLPMMALLFIWGILLLMAVDYLWLIWDSHKQTLHDKLAGTFVVSTGVRFET